MQTAQAQLTERQKIEQRLEAAQAELAEASRAFNNYERDLITTSNRLKTEPDVDALVALQSRVAGLEAMRSRYQQDVQKKRQAVENARASLTRHDDYAGQLRANIARAGIERAELDRRLTQAQSDVQEAQAAERKARAAIESHQSQIKGYEIELSRLGCAPAGGR
jgi:chromosome segregation ATPase